MDGTDIICRVFLFVSLSSFTYNAMYMYSCKNNWWCNRMHIWTASSEFGTYSLCEQRRFRRACASAQSRQNLRYSRIQAVSQEDPSDRKPDPWALWMARHAQLIFAMAECSKTQIRLTGLISCLRCRFLTRRPWSHRQMKGGSKRTNKEN